MSNVAHFDPNPPQPERGWFARNWLWFVPLVIFAPSCICCLSCAGLIMIPMQAIKSSEVYAMALEHVRQDAEVREMLGEPIEEAGFMSTGAVNVSNGNGDADIYFTVRGPKGEASVNAEATRENGRWSLTYVIVTPEDGSQSSIVWPAGEVEADFEMEFTPDESASESEATETTEPAPDAEETAPDEPVSSPDSDEPSSEEN